MIGGKRNLCFGSAAQSLNPALIGNALPPTPSCLCNLGEVPHSLWMHKSFGKPKRHFYSPFASRNPSLAPAGTVLQEDTLGATQPGPGIAVTAGFPEPRCFSCVGVAAVPAHLLSRLLAHVTVMLCPAVAQELLADHPSAPARAG